MKYSKEITHAITVIAALLVATIVADVGKHWMTLAYGCTNGSYTETK